MESSIIYNTQPKQELYNYTNHELTVELQKITVEKNAYLNASLRNARVSTVVSTYQLDSNSIEYSS